MGKKVRKEVLFCPFFMPSERREVNGMTEGQAKQIREMREQGIGYRSIALTVGLSRDIVRNFCDAWESLFVLRERNYSAREWKTEKVLLRQMQTGMVESTSGTNQQKDDCHVSSCVC